MKAVLVAIAIGCTAGCENGAAVGSGPPDGALPAVTDELVSSARAELACGNWESARRLIDEALERAPAEDWADELDDQWYAAAEGLERTEQLAGRLRALDRLAARAPRDQAGAYQLHAARGELLADLALEEGDERSLARALQAYELAISEHGAAYWLIAGRLDALRRFVRRHGVAPAQSVLGEVPPLMLRYLDDAIAADGMLPEKRLCDKGRYLIELGRDDEARETLRSALEVDPHLGTDQAFVALAAAADLEPFGNRG